MSARTMGERSADENVYVGIPPTLPPGPATAQFVLMGKLTTHVLDTASGNPAAGVRIRLYRGGALLTERVTNAGGRCDEPLLADAPAGGYQLQFAMGDYFRNAGNPSAFLDEIPIHFLVEPGRDHHVPLACSPYSYSTYRGS